MTDRTLVVCCFVLVLSGLLYSADVDASGNYSHVWVSTDSLNYIEDGELKGLLTQPEFKNILRNGAMFPDGGYAVSDGYGEISHWEPFHLTYLGWIRENFEPPWSDEARQHIAFLLGMATHGMSDQLYDGMYLERHEYYDEHGSGATLFGVDGATDACFALSQGKELELPEHWVPADVLAPLYEEASGHKVSAATIDLGHQLVVIAIMAANDALGDQEKLDEYMTLYPWACSNQGNPAMPGSPPTHGPAVARHWQVLWGRLHGDEGFAQPLLGTFFTGGTPWDQPTDSGNPDSWVHFAMPRGLAPASVNAETVVVTDLAGEVFPVNLHVYYGSASHLVNIKPQQDWTPDTEFTVTITPPLASWDGAELETTHAFTFATMPQPAPVAEEPVVEDIYSPDLATSDATGMDAKVDEAGEAPRDSGCALAPAASRNIGWLCLMALVALAVVRARRHERQ